MKLIIQLSFRNLWRQRRRNGLLVLAILIAVGGVITLNALNRGVQYDLRVAVIENLAGHFKVMQPNFGDNPSMAMGFEPSNVLEFLDDLEVLGRAARIAVPTVILSERETRGATLVGVNPLDESISFYAGTVVEGERLQESTDGRVVIGRELATQLGATVGRRLVLITQGEDQVAREFGYRVAGIYDSEKNSLERQFVFTGLDALGKRLETSKVTEVAVRLPTDDVAPALIDQVKEKFPSLEVLSWREQNQVSAFMFDMLEVAISIYIIVVLSTLVFGITNTMITAIMERTREFGLFRAVGMRPNLILLQVLTESITIVTIGLLVGLAFGAALIFWLKDGIDLSAYASTTDAFGMSSILRPHVVVQDIVTTVVVSFVLAVVASIYPARRAVKLNPLEALTRT